MTLLKGDCLDTLKTLPDCSVDSIVTDPPYELGFMGKSWDNSGIAYSVEMWSEALRILKPGGHLLAFGGTRTYHRMACAIEDAGFEIRDQIMWVYGSGFPKSHNIGKATAPATPEAQQWQGWGTALKPAHEPIVVARKPLIGTVANNVLTYGVGGLNIDGSRVGTTVETWPATRNYSSKEMSRPGSTLADDAETQSTGEAPAGRWPANFIHDGSDEVVALFPNTAPSRQGKPRGTAKKGLFANSKFNKVGTEHNDNGGSAARFFYCAKASKAERNAGLDALPKQFAGIYDGNADTEGARKIGARPDLPVQPKQNTHPTVKPLALMRHLVRLVTPPNGTVLDPFLGSGSTAVAAILEGFEWIGCEMTEDYWPIIEARVEWAKKQPPEIKEPKLF